MEKREKEPENREGMKESSVCLLGAAVRMCREEESVLQEIEDELEEQDSDLQYQALEARCALKNIGLLLEILAENECEDV